MKICACIAEYNPLHYGHLKQIEYIKQTLGAEKLIIIMSGNFTQRGEPAVLNKFKRAKQAVFAGADMVIELPTVFATANAETFANGAINVINSLGVVDGICFGVESGTKEEYLSLATAMNDESKEFKKELRANLDKGLSLCKSKFEAVKALSGSEFDEKLISSPNNILGLEYTKAILKSGTKIEIYPMLRTGDHNDDKLQKGITSAKSIRGVIKTARLKKLKKSVPPYVYSELAPYPFDFDKITVAKVITATEKELAETPDCTEGLENRIKALVKDNPTVDGLVQKVSTKRYTEARIRRILIANLLGIKREFVAECLQAKLYAKVLALAADGKDLLSLVCEKSKVPVITRKSDLTDLKKTAAKCFELDALANDLYNLAVGEKTNENHTVII